MWLMCVLEEIASNRKPMADCQGFNGVDLQFRWWWMKAWSQGALFDGITWIPAAGWTFSAVGGVAQLALGWSSHSPQPAFPLGRVSGAACPLSVRCRICSAKGSFQGDSGKCDSRVSSSPVCQRGGGEHPGKGDFCSLPSAALQPRGLGGRCHMLPFGTVSAGPQSASLSSTLAEGAGSVPAGMLPLARDGSGRDVVVKGQTCLCLACHRGASAGGRGWGAWATMCLFHCAMEGLAAAAASGISTRLPNHGVTMHLSGTITPFRLLMLEWW